MLGMVGWGAITRNGQPVRLEESRDVGRGQGRVAGRVRALGADEVAQESDDLFAVLVDPAQELSLGVVHRGHLAGEDAWELTSVL